LWGSHRSAFGSKFLLLPLALQPAVGFGLLNNDPPFSPIYHQLSPSSHSHHLMISFYFLCPSFTGSTSSSRLHQFLSEDLFEHPILLHSLQVTQGWHPCLVLLDSELKSHPGNWIFGGGFFPVVFSDRYLILDHEHINAFLQIHYLASCRATAYSVSY
jgi:hypothetical protein